jgi:hypothetical protein
MHPHRQFGKIQARTGNAPTRRKAAERRQALVGRTDSRGDGGRGVRGSKAWGPPPINRNGPYAIVSAGSRDYRDATFSFPDFEPAAGGVAALPSRATLGFHPTH